MVTDETIDLIPEPYRAFLCAGWLTLLGWKVIRDAATQSKERA